MTISFDRGDKMPATNLPTNVLSGVLAGLTESVKAGLVSLMVSVRKVESGDIQTGIDQSFKGRDVPTCWTQGSKDFGGSVGDVALVEDHVEVNISSAKSRTRRHG
jgi:hypothetical protein